MIDYTLNKQSKLLQKDRYTDTRQETEMTELLAPAGNMEALKAAVSGGLRRGLSGTAQNSAPVHIRTTSIQIHLLKRSAMHT